MSKDRDTCDREEPGEASKESTRDAHGVDFAVGAPGAVAIRGTSGRRIVVMRLHRLERALPRGDTLLIEPCRLDLRLDFFVRGDAPGSDGQYEDEMPTQARLDWPLPGPCSNLID